MSTREEPGDLEEELPPPRGTLFVLLLFIMAIAGMWGAVYWMLLGR